MYWFSIFNSSSMQVSFFVWKLMKWAATDSLSTSPQQSTQALEYLFKFIVQSRILYSRATCGMEEEQFRASIQELFQSIRFVLSLDSRSSENLVFTQVRRFTLQTTLKIPLMSPAHQPFLSFVIIFFCNFQFYSLSVCIHISLLEFVNFFYFCDFYLLFFWLMLPSFTATVEPSLAWFLDSLGLSSAACLSVFMLLGSRPPQ